MQSTNPPTHPTFREALRFWLKLGLISFGGPTGQIAIMHTELVEKRRWISEERFLHALNYCMLLPGPEAQQLATYIGWLLHRTWGGIVAGCLFVLPSALLLWVLSVAYVMYGDVPWIAAVFDGLKPAVLAIVAAAALRIGRRALRNPALWALAAFAFAALFFFSVPFPAVMAAAGLIGYFGSRWKKSLFEIPSPHASGGSSALGEKTPHTRPSLARAMKVISLCLALWWLPVLGLGGWLGWQHAVFREGLFFSKASMVTFGGAYAVLPYVSQQAVEHYGWVTAGQMLDGLGLAETTPGPLIMVLQFVGFLGGWNQPGPLPPLVSATLGAMIATWTTFVPCFLWIFLGAPHIEQLRGNTRLSAALTGITAAVTGVILNLAVWFGIHVLVPDGKTPDTFSLMVAFASFLALTRAKWDVIAVIAAAAGSGILFRFLNGGL